MSYELKQFYRAMQEWIDGGCKEDNQYGFIPQIGLCNNLINFTQVTEGDYKEDFLEEMKQQFHEAGLDKDLPFNENISYVLERDKGIRYKNLQRLAWVKQHAA